MSERIMGPRGSRRRRRSLVACVASVAALGAFVTPNAFAVHDAGNFELDGNAVSGNATPAADDWDRVCHQVTSGAECASATKPTRATAVSWPAEPDPAASRLAA